MKYFLSLILILTTAFAEAQIVNIPDSNFKNALLRYDTNHDGEIQVTEALAVHRMTMEEGSDFPISQPVTNTEGLNAFKNLDTLLYITRSPIIDLSGLTKLKFFYFFGIYDNVSYTRSLNLSGCSSLQGVYTNYAELTNIDLTGCTGLKTANFGGVNIPDFNPGVPDSVWAIEMNNNILCKNVDLSGCKNLTTFYSQNNYLRSLDFSGLKKLSDLIITSDSLEEINFSGCEQLTNYQSHSRVLKKLIVNGCTSLNSIHLPATAIDSLDLSTCPNLTTFFSYGFGSTFPVQLPKLKYLNLKNGTRLTTMRLELADSVMVCADEFEIAAVTNDILTSNISNFNDQPTVRHFSVNPYCSNVPGGIYNIIKGTIRRDYNNNGCDSADAASVYVPVRLIDSTNHTTVNYTNTSGNYVHYPYAGRYTVAPYFPYAHYNLSPASSNVNFDSANNLTSTNDFCISGVGLHNDLDVSFLPAWPPARPGFDPAYVLIYKNRGTTTLSGNVQLNYDDNKLNFLSASTVAATQTDGQLTWLYNNLQPFETRSINVTFHLLPPPVNNNGDTIYYTVAITPSANDETPYDNSFVLPQGLRGAFDPNDKQCLQGDKLDIAAIDKPLDYVIHFQNLGTDTVFNVIVADTLSNNYDWNSFEFTGSSHPVSVKQKDNTLEFVFNNIQLPYKAINEPASNGFVAYKIKPKSILIIGDSLNNKASIYFDFNIPVVTNLAKTIVSNISTPVAIKLESFTAVKAGSTHVLRWKASCTANDPSFVIERSNDGLHFTAIGQLSSSTDRCRLPYRFTDGSPLKDKNYYRIKMTDADGVTSYTRVLVLSDGDAGLSITAIAGNMLYFNAVKPQRINVQILAADGKLLYSDAKNLSEGAGQLNLGIQHLPSGVYTIMINFNEGVVARRFVR